MRSFCSHKPHNWVKWIPWHFAAKISPYRALYGRHPPTLLDYIPKIAKLQSVEEELISRDIALQLLKDNLVKANNIMKKFADN